MTQNWDLNYGNVVHEGFFDPIQELLGASVPSLRIFVLNATTLRIAAGTGNDQVAVAIEGRHRWVTSTVNASLPGGLTNGVGDVFVTASDNLYDGAVGDPDINTIYTFGLEIIAAGGTPATDLYRKVGEVDVSSSAIIAYRSLAGSRPSGSFGLTATPDSVTQQALILTGLASQTGDLMQVKNSGGTVIWSLSAAGALSTSAGLASSSTDGLTLSGNGGNDTLNLSNTTAGTGITIGGDVTVYRNAADELRTDDQFTIKRGATSAALTTQVGSETYPRVKLLANGELSIGAGSAAGDVRIRRSAANVVTVDDGSGGAATLAVTGGLTTTTSLAVGSSATIATTLGVTGTASVGGLVMTGTTANKVPISDGSGVMTPALLANAQIDAAAAIAHSKLASATAGYLLMGNASNAVTATAVTGDVTISSTGVTTIGATKVTNGMLAGSIALTKLAAVTAGFVVMGNGSNVATATALSGDVTIDSSGATTIGATKVTNGMLAGSIALTKLASVTAGQVVMGNASNVATGTALSGAVTINGSGVTTLSTDAVTNSHIIASAQITHSKLANTSAGSLLMGNGSGVITSTAMSGDVTINSSGVTAIGTGKVTPDMLSRDAGLKELTADTLLPSAVWTAVLSMDFGSPGHWVINANGVMTDPSAVPGAYFYYYISTPDAGGSVQIASADNNNRVAFGCSAILYSSTGVITLAMYAAGGGKTSVKSGTHMTAHRISA